MLALWFSSASHLTILIVCKVKCTEKKEERTQHEYHIHLLYAHTKWFVCLESKTGKNTDL